MNEVELLPSLRRDIERLLEKLAGEVRVVVSVHQEEGPQGASGSKLRYLSVQSRSIKSELFRQRIVVKECEQLERQTLALLTMQGQPVPPMVFGSAEKDGSGAVVMVHAEPWHELGLAPALQSGALGTALARLHATNLGKPRPWMPRVADDPRARLWLVWPGLWEQALRDDGFAAEFGALTSRLHSATESFLTDLHALELEGTWDTLLNVDLHPGHIREWHGAPVIIDWEQCAYGPLFLDLPNAFSVETILSYRDGLAVAGHEYPVVEFIERYRQIGRFMGVRWLGAALEDWLAGGERRARRRWWLYFTLTMALGGR